MATTVCRSPQPTAVTRRQRSGQCAQRSILVVSAQWRGGQCRLISSASVVVVVTVVQRLRARSVRDTPTSIHARTLTRTQPCSSGIGAAATVHLDPRALTRGGFERSAESDTTAALRLSPLYAFYGVRSGPRGPNSDDVSAKPSHGRLCTCSTASSDGAYRNGEAPSTSSVRLLLGPRFAFSRARLSKIGALRWEAAAGGREHGPAKCGADGEGFNTLCFTLSGSALGISSGSELLATSWRHP
jgi:hypothetical protein